MLTGFEVFMQGTDLRNGLIDIDKVYDIVIEKESEQTETFTKPLGATR